MKTEKKVLLVDMDHVIADLTSQYIKYYKEATGIEMRRNDLLGKPEEEAFPAPKLIRSFLRTPGMFRNAAVIKDSQCILQELNELFSASFIPSETASEKSEEKDFCLLKRRLKKAFIFFIFTMLFVGY